MSRQNRLRYQEGVATLGITLMLLFIVTLVTLYTAKTSIKEQQVSANQYRADQSLSTGNAALDWGIAYFSEARGFVCDERLVGMLTDYFTACPPLAADDKATMCTIKSAAPTKCVLTYNKSNPLVIDPDQDDNITGDDDALSVGSSEMYFAFVDRGEGCDSADGDADGLCEYIPVSGGAGESNIWGEEIRIVGTGRSDDDTGMRAVSLDVGASNIFGDPGLGASAFPLVTKTATGANANTSVINRFDNRSIWSGNDLSLSGSINTYIMDERVGWNCNDIRNHDKCVTYDSQGGDPLYTIKASDGQNNVNADIIDADPNLSNLAADDFFKNFFGQTKTELRQLARDMGHLITGDSGGNLTDMDGNSVVWSDLAGMTPLVWIDLPAGAEYVPSGNDLGQLGEETDPMVMIVDGDLGVGGTGSTARILIGVLYVIGTWDFSANMVIQGMAIVETLTNLSGAGSPTVIYDADLFSGKIGPPPGIVATPVPGSWRDWD